MIQLRNDIPRRGKRKKERSTAIDFTLRPDSPAMLSNYPIDRCQTDSGSFEILRTMQPLEYCEKLMCVLLFEARAVVPNVDDVLVLGTPPDFNDGLLGAARVLHGIGKKINEHLLH